MSARKLYHSGSNHSTSGSASDAFTTAPQSFTSNDGAYNQQSDLGIRLNLSHSDGSSADFSVQSVTDLRPRSRTSAISIVDSQKRRTPIYHGYRPPTAETISSSDSYRQVPNQDYVIHDIIGTARSLDSFYATAPMSGALSGSHILLPALPDNDYVLEASHPINNSSRATANTPNPNLPKNSAGPIRSFFWRNASQYLSMPRLVSSDESQHSRQQKPISWVLSSIQSNELPFNTRRVLVKVLELRSNDLGPSRGPVDWDHVFFNWQLRYDYNISSPMPTIYEEARQHTSQHSDPDEPHLLDRILSGTQYLEALSHLKDGNLVHPSRHEKGCVTCVDLGVGKCIPKYMASSWGNSDAHVDWDLENTSWDMFQRKLLEPIRRNVHTRLLVVEDVSQNTMRFLGTHFNVSPEFFEEHLINSGYRNGFYQDQPPDSWSTHGLKKNYKSIKWYRPVFRQHVRPISRKSEEDLLSLGHVAYPTQTRRKEIYRTETNIFRSKWELSTNPTDLYGRRICGWEERASIWSSKIGNTRYVILLLDPLPTLARGGTQLREIPGDHQFNKERPEESAVNDNIPPPTRRNTFISKEPIKGRPAPKIPNAFEKFALRLLRTLKFKVEVEIEVDEERLFHNPQQFEKIFQKTDTVHLVKQVSTRTHMTHEMYSNAFVSTTDFDDFNDQISLTRSTKAEFMDWLNTPSFYNAHENSSLGVGSPLIQIMIADTISLCRIIRHGLKQISQDIVEESRMEEGLSLWRQYIGRCQRELPELQSSICDFYDALHSDSDSDEGVGDTKNVRSQQMNDLLLDIEKLKDEVSKSAASLTSNMSLLDSKRSIAEAQSVKKLTELAFLFIPATFSASLFGMEIEQLSTPAPLWVFIAIALSFTTFSYFIRLVIRSHTIEDIQLRTADSIGHYVKAKKITNWHKGQPVPTSLFIKWILFQMRRFPGRVGSKAGDGLKKAWAMIGFYLASVSMISIIAVAPIAVLVTRKHLDIPIKIGASVAIILFSFLVVVVPYWRASTPEFRTALPRLVFSSTQKVVGSKFFRKGGLGVLILVAASIPLVIVWTQDLAMGVKAAITTAVAIGMLCGGAYVLIRRLVNIARADWEEDDSDDTSLADD